MTELDTLNNQTASFICDQPLRTADSVTQSPYRHGVTRLCKIHKSLKNSPIVFKGKLIYSKTCVKRPIKNRQNKNLNDKDLMKVKSIAECSP